MVDAYEARQIDQMNIVITGHYRQLEMDRAKRPKKLGHYLIKQKSTRVKALPQSPQAKAAAIDTFFGGS